MAHSFEHFYIQDLVDQALDEVLSWIDGAAIGPINPSTTHEIDTALNNISPTELRVDSAHLIEHGQKKQVVVIETQLRRDPKKFFAIARYNAAYTALYECPSMVLVLTPERSVARWARTKARRFRSPWGQIHVIGPEDVPTDFPGFDTDKQRSIAFLRAALTRDVRLLNAILEQLKRQIHTDAFEPESYKQYIITLERIAPTDWWARLTETNMEFVSTVEKYERRGLQRGREEGREEGLLLGFQRAIEQLANARDIELTDDSRARVHACKNQQQLEQWLAHVGMTTEKHVTLP